MQDGGKKPEHLERIHTDTQRKAQKSAFMRRGDITNHCTSCTRPFSQQPLWRSVQVLPMIKKKKITLCAFRVRVNELCVCMLTQWKWSEVELSFKNILPCQRGCLLTIRCLMVSTHCLISCSLTKIVLFHNYT